jgi:hypothetical protein
VLNPPDGPKLPRLPLAPAACSLFIASKSLVDEAD